MRADVGDDELRADNLESVLRVKRRGADPRVEPDSVSAARDDMPATRAQQRGADAASLCVFQHRHPAQLPRTDIGCARRRKMIERRDARHHAVRERAEMPGLGIVIVRKHALAHRPVRSQDELTDRNDFLRRDAANADRRCHVLTLASLLPTRKVVVALNFRAC